MAEYSPHEENKVHISQFSNVVKGFWRLPFDAIAG
jgi:hypothetical protein